MREGQTTHGRFVFENVLSLCVELKLRRVGLFYYIVALVLRVACICGCLCKLFIEVLELGEIL